MKLLFCFSNVQICIGSLHCTAYTFEQSCVGLQNGRFLYWVHVWWYPYNNLVIETIHWNTFDGAVDFTIRYRLHSYLKTETSSTVYFEDRCLYLLSQLLNFSSSENKSNSAIVFEIIIHRKIIILSLQIPKEFPVSLIFPIYSFSFPVMQRNSVDRCNENLCKV